jgi:hypothetical protein
VAAAVAGVNDRLLARSQPEAVRECVAVRRISNPHGVRHSGRQVLDEEAGLTAGPLG